VAAELVFAVCADHIWEDYFITVKHSINLCKGNGLTYHPGTRVHGFTSPLGVLLPAACYALTGTEAHRPALWLFRVFCIGAYAGGLYLLLRGLQQSRQKRYSLAVFTVAVLYCLDPKLMMFTINGMETAFMLLFTAAAVWTLASGVSKHSVALGIAWAGMMWTRPDSFVYIGAMGLALVLFTRGPRKELLIAMSKAAAVCTAIYLPWFVWAWMYYGTPVPHTVTAKSTAAFAFIELLKRMRMFPGRCCGVFLPAYAEYGNWRPFLVFAGLLGFVSSFYWLVPYGDLLGRRCSFVAFCGILYLTLIPRCFPWYYPTVHLLALPALAAAVSRLCSYALRSGSPTTMTRAVRGLVAGIVAAQILVVWIAVPGTKAAFETNEWGHRRKIGLWLKEHAAPGDRVFLECVGYIGFFSQLHMLDYPGLVSPEVVEARRNVGDNMAAAGMMLRPEWMVLRPQETVMFDVVRDGWLLHNYAPVKLFDNREQLSRARGNRQISSYDAVFWVFQRRPQSPGRPETPDPATGD